MNAILSQRDPTVLDALHHDNSIPPPDDSGSHIGPYFDTTGSKNVTALLGKTAYLNCRVKNLGNKTVSGNN